MRLLAQIAITSLLATMARKLSVFLFKLASEPKVGHRIWLRPQRFCCLLHRTHLLTVTPVFSVCLLSGCGTGAEQHSRGESPAEMSTVVCRQPVWDFGTIDPLEIPRVDHTFQIENTGQVSVEVEDVDATCGCIVPKDHPTEIPAGAVGEFPMGVKTAGHPGPFRKSIEVRLKTSPPTSIYLSIVGEITANSQLYSVPSILDFGRVKQGEPKRQTVKLMRYDGARVSNLTTTARHSCLRLIKSVPSGESQEIVELEFELDAGSQPQGRFESLITVEAEHADRSLAIPVRAIVSDSAVGLLDTIVVSKLSPGGTAVRPLLRSGSDSSLKIHEVTYEGPEILKVTLEEEGDGQPVLHVQRSSAPCNEPLVRTQLQFVVGPEHELVERLLIVILAADSQR